MELLAFVIENHEDARPYQEGLGEALTVFEFLVEGFISRFAAIFDASSLPPRIGPIRSLRPYFVDALAPWVSAFLYAGGSPEAIERIQEIPNLYYWNGLGFAKHFLRKAGVPAPHDLFIEYAAILDLTKDTELPQKPWPPYKLGQAVSDSGATTITLNFLNPDHNVRYTYHSIIQTYTRVNGGIESEAHPKNILILEAPITEVREYGRLEIPLLGRGRALLFRSGTVTPGVWERGKAEVEEQRQTLGADTPASTDVAFSPSDLANAPPVMPSAAGAIPRYIPRVSRDTRDDIPPKPLRFLGIDGNPLAFAKGQTWITVLPTLERVKWEG